MKFWECHKCEFTLIRNNWVPLSLKGQKIAGN